MMVVSVRCRAEDGTLYSVETIASNEDYVANLIAEGHCSEVVRWKEVARLYRAQLRAKQRQLVGSQAELRAVRAKIVELVAQ